MSLHPTAGSGDRSTGGSSAETLTAAWNAAERAAADSRIDLREVRDIVELQHMQQLFERIWRTGPTGTPVTADMLRAIAKAEGYVVGAFDNNELVGACFGFFGPPVQRTLHSHIAGVDPRMHGRHIGFAMKVHQRAWAMQREAKAITWTFDPLIRRNAYFNLAKLGASISEYLPSFYGPMDDEINRSDDTDRALVRWRLGSSEVSAACELGHTVPRGTPRAESAVTPPAAHSLLEVSAQNRPVMHELRPGLALVSVPHDIEALRLRDPALAGEWRIALRDTLGMLMQSGARVLGFHRDGWYVVDTKEAS